MDGDVVGVVLAGPDPDDPDIAHLSRLYVDPGQWGAGIGTELHRAAVVDLADRGFPAATLWVPEGNSRARRWYERLGWGQTHRRKATFEPAGIYDAQYLLPLHRDQWRATCDAR